MDYFRNKPKRPVRTLAAHFIGLKMASANFYVNDAKMWIFRFSGLRFIVLQWRKIYINWSWISLGKIRRRSKWLVCCVPYDKKFWPRQNVINGRINLRFDSFFRFLKLHDTQLLTSGAFFFLSSMSKKDETLNLMHTPKPRSVRTNFAIQHTKISEIQRLGRSCLLAPLIYKVSLLMNDITTDPHVGFQKSKKHEIF